MFAKTEMEVGAGVWINILSSICCLEGTVFQKANISPLNRLFFFVCDYFYSLKDDELFMLFSKLCLLHAPFILCDVPHSFVHIEAIFAK